MSRVLLINAGNLLGKELRERLATWPGLPSDVSLVSTREEEIGTLTEVGGAAAVVGPYDREDLGSAQLALLCGTAASDGPLLADLPPTCAAVVLSAGATAEQGRPAVAGVSSVLPGEGALVSPHPAAVALAHLLHALRGLEPIRAVATVVLPASMHGEPALDELFQQTRCALTFAPQPESPSFGGQLAFNLVALPEAGDRIVEQTQSALGGTPPQLAVQALEAGVFHAVSISLWVELAEGTTARQLRHALALQAPIELVRDGERLGPIDAASSERLLVGGIRPDPNRAGAYWLWAVMDNLTTGGAINALGLASDLLAGGVS